MFLKRMPADSKHIKNKNKKQTKKSSDQQEMQIKITIRSPYSTYGSDFQKDCR